MKKILLTLFLISLMTSGFSQQARQLLFREDIFDFGKIAEDKGPVVHDFIFTNNSQRPVKILKVQASCGCTTPGWSKEPVAPGKTGFVQASFNPKGRPGFFNKSLTVTTDLEPSPVILQIKGQVSTGRQPTEDEFPIAKGSLRFKRSSFNMGKVFLKDEYVVRKFEVFNSGADSVRFTGKFAGPKHIQVEAAPEVLAPGEKGIVTIRYNGGIKNMYGFQSDNVELYTDDEENPVKSFSVYATMEDYFPNLSPGELSKAPRLQVDDLTFDLGRLKPATPGVHEVLLTNKGEKELEIRFIQPNCTCVTAVAADKKIKPGDNTILKIIFDPHDRTGTQQKAVTLYSNDPVSPVQMITFTAYIEN